MRSRHGKLDEHALPKLLGVKAVIFDGDGVVTNNQVIEGIEIKPKWRSHYDGQGISLLRAIGIHVCFITNEKDASAAALIAMVDRWNNLPSTVGNMAGGWNKVSLFVGCAGINKVVAAREWLDQCGLDWESCAMMGDDLVDLPLFKMVSFRAAPSSAEYVIRDLADFVSRRPGGAGAIRDFANLILEARGIDQTRLPTQ